MQITKPKTKRIYKKAMAEFLMDNGCTLVERVPDMVRDDRFNWLFVDNELLQDMMGKFPRKQED